MKNSRPLACFKAFLPHSPRGQKEGRGLHCMGMFTKLGRDKECMAPHDCLAFLSDPSKGGSSMGKNRSRVSSLLKKKLLQTGRLHQQTECIAMI